MILFSRHDAGSVLCHLVQFKTRQPPQPQLLPRSSLARKVAYAKLEVNLDYTVLIILVSLRFYKCYVHKYNLPTSTQTKVCASCVISGAPTSEECY